MSIPKNSDFITQSCDYPAMADIWLRASLQTHRFIDRAYWCGNFETMCDAYLPVSENYAYFDTDGNMSGFVSLSGGGHVEALFVAPERQGRGVGRALLGYAKELYDKLTLAVYEENGPAVRFYERNGFAIIDRRMEERTGHPELLITYTRA